MILFFYGPNDYSLKMKLRELKAKYRTASKGSFDLVTLEGSSLKAENFLAQTQAVALFASTRLVIVEQIFDAPKETQDKIKECLDKISSASIVVFTHLGEPDKRVGLFKALNKPKISQHFKNLESSDLPRFIAREAEERGAKFDRGASSFLLETVGNNLWQLANEIEKLATYKAGDLITKEDIELLVSKNIYSNVFALTDALVNKNTQKAFTELEFLLHSAEPPLKILGAINYQFRLIALVKDELDRGTNQREIPSLIKMQPFQVSRAAGVCKRLSWQDLSQVYSELVKLDEHIKTGKIEPEEALKDLLLNI